MDRGSRGSFRVVQGLAVRSSTTSAFEGKYGAHAENRRIGHGYGSSFGTTQRHWLGTIRFLPKKIHTGGDKLYHL